MRDVEKLYQLQKIDTRLKEIKSALQDQTELKKLVEMKKNEQIIRVKLTNLEEQSKSGKRQMSQIELELADIIDKIAIFEEKLYGGSIKNSKELEHLQLNHQTLKKQKDEFEEEIIQLMEQNDEFEKELKVLRKEFYTRRDDCLGYEKKIKEKLLKLRSKEKEYLKRREKILKMIPAVSFQYYQKVLQRHDGIAVALIQDSICTGCQVSLPEALIDRVRTNEEFVHCEFCGRILFTIK